MNIKKLKQTFRKHVENYNLQDTNITRKLYHSYRVMDLCLIIAKNYHFNKKDKEISILIGLLHDYARFEQWTRFGTYNDIESIDHGDLAVKRLFLNKEIINYCNKEEYYDEIYDAIKYHNKYSYPDNLSEHNKLFCKIIKDADKLDIFYLFSLDKELLKEDTEEISEKIKVNFFKNKLLNRLDVKNNSDNIILNLAMIFELNFEWSYNYLYDMKFIDKIYENINNKNKFKPYFDYIKKYIESKLI